MAKLKTGEIEKIRRHRAGNRCECTGQCGRSHAGDARCPAELRWMHPELDQLVVIEVIPTSPEPRGAQDYLAVCQACRQRIVGPRPAAPRRPQGRRRPRDLFEASKKGKGDEPA